MNEETCAQLGGNNARHFYLFLRIGLITQLFMFIAGQEE